MVHFINVVFVCHQDQTAAAAVLANTSSVKGILTVIIKAGMYW